MVDNVIGSSLGEIFVCSINGKGPSIANEKEAQVTEACVKTAMVCSLVFCSVRPSFYKVAKEPAAYAKTIGLTTVFTKMAGC